MKLRGMNPENYYTDRTAVIILSTNTDPETGTTVTREKERTGKKLTLHDQIQRNFDKECGRC
jgi:hypothetical protein